MGAPHVTDLALDRFNGLGAGQAREALRACCASAAWVHRLATGRPYRSRADLMDTAELACRELDDSDLEEALSAHPRIGERATGTATEARWSQQEQASVATRTDRTRAELGEVNLAYEQRFGRVFLIRAAGRSPVEMLAEARRRVRNDSATERCEVAGQLGQIARLRVERLLEA